MEKKIITKIILFTKAWLLAGVMFFLFGFKILDNDKSVPFFQKISEILDIYGIDIIQDWNSNVISLGRPVLAPIANYNVSVLEKESEWTSSFTNFYSNAIVALETEQPIDATTFIDNWKLFPAEKRIFISFTKDDLEHAENVKITLESNGYKVFLYTENNRLPFTSPEMIVYCMKTAGEVLVLDTEKSRFKEGVIAEALNFAKYTFKKEEVLVAENEQIKRQITNYLDNLKINFNPKDEIISNTKKYYKNKEGKTIMTQKVLMDFKKIYGIEIGKYDYNKSFKEGKTKYLSNLFVNNDLTPYSYNKKLLEEFSTLQKTSANDFFKIDYKSPFNFLSYFAFCPVYKIPIMLCPICSRRLRILK